MACRACHVACFISPHGYGHASRTAACMAALHELIPDISFDIYTHVPKHFFEQSLVGPFSYTPMLSDIGLAQHDAMHEDIPETIHLLNELMPFDPGQIQQMAERLKERQTTITISDISPLGILIANAAQIPSVLIENFTWDWIYQAYSDSHPAIIPHANYLADCFVRATYHIQTQPVCDLKNADLITQPVSRQPHASQQETREKLQIQPERKMVLVSMGGIPEKHSFLEALHGIPDTDFVLPGTVAKPRRHKNTIELPHNSAFYHPDLVNAADCVIGKVGYSTIAEVFHASIPFGYVNRPHFRESPPLASFIEANMPSQLISLEDFRSGNWTDILPTLLTKPHRTPVISNGADTIARFIADKL